MSWYLWRSWLADWYCSCQWHDEVRNRLTKNKNIELALQVDVNIQSPSHDMQFSATASTELVTVLVAPALSCSRLTDKRLIPITAHVHSLYVSSCGARSQTMSRYNTGTLDFWYRCDSPEVFWVHHWVWYRNWILFRHVLQVYNQVWYALALTFHYGRGSYAMCNCTNIWYVYEMRINPALSGSTML